MSMMQTPYPNPGVAHHDFVLIGDPVAHSLSPVMHNKLYRELALTQRHFSSWHYEAIRCQSEQEAIDQINRVRMGHFRGMNITMPYKRLAVKNADYVDSSADAAGGANVLVRKEFELYAYNTDGLGALGAVSRVGGIDPSGKRVAVCGTGPTSMAIAAAFANASAGEVVIFSRDGGRARSTVQRLRMSLVEGSTFWLRPAEYGDAAGLVPSMDILIDATPNGMHEGDDAIVDPMLFHEGQIVLDVVYAHGVTKLVEGARTAGAFAMDGLEMLVEQAALSVEIWAEAMGIDIEVPRAVMRDAALAASL